MIDWTCSGCGADLKDVGIKARSTSYESYTYSLNEGEDGTIEVDAVEDRMLTDSEWEYTCLDCDEEVTAEQEEWLTDNAW